MRLVRRITLVVLCAGIVAGVSAPASPAAGTCTATGKSVAPLLGDHGTDLALQCTDTIATTTLHTTGSINGLQWTDAEACHFEDHDFTCTWHPTQQAAGRRTRTGGPATASSS